MSEAHLAALRVWLESPCRCEWVDWFNNRRLLEPIGNIPPPPGLPEAVWFESRRHGWLFQYGVVALLGFGRQDCRFALYRWVAIRHKYNFLAEVIGSQCLGDGAPDIATLDARVANSTALERSSRSTPVDDLGLGTPPLNFAIALAISFPPYRLFCVSTVSGVCTIKAPVPVRAEDGLDPPRVHCR
jgi:hypothetical protein